MKSRFRIVSIIGIVAAIAAIIVILSWGPVSQLMKNRREIAPSSYETVEEASFSDEKIELEEAGLVEAESEEAGFIETDSEETGSIEAGQDKTEIGEAEPEEYTIQYYLDPESSAPSELKTTAIPGETTQLLTLKELGFSKDGYVFEGWRIYREVDNKWYLSDREGNYLWHELKNNELPEGILTHCAEMVGA